MFLSCSHSATGDVEEKKYVRWIIPPSGDTEGEGGECKKLKEFARISEKNKTESLSAKEIGRAVLEIT